MSSQSGGMSSMDKIQFADLHVFVVPLDLWLEKYRTAFNNIALESVSAGFVRVPPDASLSTLRDHIEDQLGLDIVPESFVFLRSVGRCMAIVKNNQEDLLRARDFLPPVAYSPEIFVLPGTHSSLARPIPEANNVVIATQGLTTAGLSSTQPISLPAIHGMNFQMSAQGPHQKQHPDQYTLREQSMCRSESNNEADRFNNNSRPTLNQDNRENPLRRENLSSEGSDSEEMISTLNSSFSRRRADDVVESAEVRASDQHNEKQRQKNSKSKLQKKGSSDSSGSTKSGSKTVKFIQPEVVPNMPVVAPDGVFISPATPIPSGRVIASSQPGDAGGSDRGEDRSQGEKLASSKNGSSVSENQRQVSKSQKAAAKKKRRGRSRSPSVDRERSSDDTGSVSKSKYVMENEDVGVESKARTVWEIPNIEDVEERSKFSQFPSPDQKNRKPLLYENEVDSGIAEDGSTPPFGDQGERLLYQNGSVGYQGHGSGAYDHTGYDDDNTVGLQQNGVREHQFIENFETGQQGSEGFTDTTEASGGDSMRLQVEKIQKKESNSGTTDKAKVTLKKGKKPLTKKVAKKPDSLEDKFRIPKMPDSLEDKFRILKKPDSLEDKFRIPKMRTPPQIKMPARDDKNLEKDTASSKDRKLQEIEQLKGELRRAKQERVDVEKDREQKIRRAKNVQNQTLQKRNQAKNVWKKRFFDEKRKTAPLEEQVNRLRYDMQLQHKAILSYLESKDREGNKAEQDVDKKPSVKSNQRMLLARLQHEVEDLRQRVEDTKMKLAAEMKMRDASQKELKEIREQLLEKKISLTQLSKHEKGFPGHVLNTPENITA